MVVARRDPRASTYSFLLFLFAYVTTLTLYRIAWVNNQYHTDSFRHDTFDGLGLGRPIVEDRSLHWARLQEEPVDPLVNDEFVDFVVVGLDHLSTSVFADWIGEHSQISMRQEGARTRSHGDHQIIHGYRLEWQDEWRKILQKSWKTKLIVVLRHPVRWLGDFLSRQPSIRNDAIQQPQSFIGPCREPGQLLCTDKADVVSPLLKLGKIMPKQNQRMDGSMNESPPSWQSLSQNDIQLHPNPVFLLTWEQLTETNVHMQQKLLSDLEAFLSIKEEPSLLDLFGRERMLTKHAVLSNVRDNLNVCDSDLLPIRRMLTSNGKMSAQWINEDFLTTSTVTCSQMHWLAGNIETWGDDPCLYTSNADPAMVEAGASKSGL